jgi:phage protein D
VIADLLQVPGMAGQSVLVPRFSLAVEGVPLPAPVMAAFLSVSVAQEANEPASFQLEVNDPQFLLVEAAGGLLAEGRRVEIALGYVGNTLPMIEGEISAIDVNLDEGGGLTLGIEGFDGLHAGTRGTASRSFDEGKSDSAIVREVASELLPTAVVDETPPRTHAEAQSEESTLAFLQRLAKRNGFQLWAEGRTLFFMRRRLGPALRFARGRNLISFSARLSTAGQAGAVEVRSWDAARQQVITATAAANLSPDYLAALSATGLAQIAGQALGIGAKTGTRVIHAQARASSIAEAQDLADAEMQEQRRKLLTASGSVVGDPNIRVGSLVSLENMGRFSLHPYVVEQATHRIDASGYRTTFTMRQYL